MTITNQSLKLKRTSGVNIDLTTAPYALGGNFTIPTLAESPIFAGGSSSNVYGGSSRSSLRFMNRSWSFDIRILSTTIAGVQLAARRVADFLNGLSDTDKTYIEYRTNTDTPEPLWGQYGTAFRYEVVDAQVSLNPDYAEYIKRSEYALLTITVSIKPSAETKQQRVCVATGGIFEDMIGSVDGRSRGVTIPEATTNMITNPVFGNATYSSGWTTGANLFSPKNTDKQYILFGEASVKLTANFNTGTLYSQTITFAVNTYTLSCYAKLEDSSAVTTSHILMWYDAGSVTPTYTSIGNGWYRLVGTFTGAVGAKTVGVTIENNSTVYVDGFQLEAKDHVTPLAYGDLLGCAWTGTVHASTSTRTAAACKLAVGDDTIMPENGSIRVVWIPNRPSTGAWLSSVGTLFDTRNGASAALSAYYNATDDKFYFSDGTNTISTAAQSFAAGDVLILHFTWNKSGLNIYKNGANASSGNSFSMFAFGNYVFIGTSNAPDKPCDGTLSLSIFEHELTSGQVLNDYSNLAPVVARNERVNSVPWLWTVSGDNIFSLDTNKSPLGIVGGVPGTLPAITEFQGTLSDTWPNIKSIVLSSFANRNAIPLAYFLADQSGAATAGDYGGEHADTTVTTALTPIALTYIDLTNKFKMYFGGEAEIHAYSRIKSSAGIAGYVYNRYYDGTYHNTDQAAVTFATGYRGHLSKSLRVSTLYNLTLSQQLSRFFFAANIVTGSVTLSCDYFAILPRPIATLVYGGGLANTAFALKGRNAFTLASAVEVDDGITYTGDVIEFVPDCYNHLQIYFCPDGTVNPVTTYTCTLSAVYITPRWALL